MDFQYDASHRFDRRPLCLPSLSGGHFNPAVYDTLWAGGRFSGSQLTCYIVAQVIGDIAKVGRGNSNSNTTQWLENRGALATVEISVDIVRNE